MLGLTKKNPSSVSSWKCLTYFFSCLCLLLSLSLLKLKANFFLSIISKETSASIAASLPNRASLYISYFFLLPTLVSSLSADFMPLLSYSFIFLVFMRPVLIEMEILKSNRRIELKLDAPLHTHWQVIGCSYHYYLHIAS